MTLFSLRASRAQTFLAVVAWALSALTMAASPAEAQTGSASGVSDLSVAQIVSKLEEKNQERAEALRALEGTRTYHLQYRGFPGSKDAGMLVEMNFRSPTSKSFKILSQTGSKFIIDHVLMKLLQSEQEALQAENRRQTALSAENYEFSLTGYEQKPDGGRYILTVAPRSKNKFLYRGRIWVDGRDFAVTHIEGEPAKNPSFWIKKTSIRHEYTKVGDFWLPVQNRTESQTRLGGTALLTIDYSNYRIVSVAPEHKGDRARIETAGAVQEGGSR